MPGAWAVPGAPPTTAAMGFPPSAQGDPFATPHFPAPPTMPLAQPPPHAGAGAGAVPSIYPPIPPQQQQQQPQQPYPAQAGGGWGPPSAPVPPQSQQQQPPQPPAYYGAAPPVAIQLPPGAVRPLGGGPPRKPPTLSIEDAFSGLGLDGSSGASSAGGGSLQHSGGGGGGGGSNLPAFAAGEAVVYTDSQGNRARVTVVKVCM